MGENEVPVNPAFSDQNLYYAVEKRDIAASRDRKPIIGDIGAEQGAIQGRWHPIPFHAGLTIGIDQHHFGSERFRFVQVFGGYRLIIGRVRPEKDDEVSAEPILVAARGGGDTQRMFHRRGAGGVTKPRGVINVVGAQKTRGFLSHVINFVGDATRSDEKCQPFRIDHANFAGDSAISFIP